ncbi:M23 family metallopeptidase [Rhizobium mesosinicum]|uniref:M23 family metallopeptidase n=2 Tax=Rhizobium mesosinicum TaxID=335017 RepID=A0ABS7GM28_9HYPH|nr:M23 family metallopeptidase [Rhizobium mesosinicum]
MAHRFRYDIALVVIILSFIYFFSSLFDVIVGFTSTRSTRTCIAFITMALFFFFGTTWLLRYDFVRYAKHRAFYYQFEMTNDYTRFLTLVGDQYYFGGMFNDAVRLWTLAGGERNLEKVRILSERHALAEKVFVASRERERRYGPNTGTYFATMQAVYLYPSSENFQDKFRWYIDALNSSLNVPCENLIEAQYWLFYGRKYDLKPDCRGTNYREKWHVGKFVQDLDLLRQRRDNSENIFEMLARSEAETLSNSGHEIIKQSILTRLYHRAVNPDGKQDFVYEADAGWETADVVAGTEEADFQWPIALEDKNVVTIVRGSGIDIQASEGTPVLAAQNGVVIYAGEGLKELGATILVRHDSGLVTVYGHNNALFVKRGQKVARGERIASSGTSGDTWTSKLHFEVRKDASPVNPMRFLPTQAPP